MTRAGRVEGRETARINHPAAERVENNGRFLHVFIRGDIVRIKKYNIVKKRTMCASYYNDCGHGVNHIKHSRAERDAAAFLPSSLVYTIRRATWRKKPLAQSPLSVACTDWRCFFFFYSVIRQKFPKYNSHFESGFSILVARGHVYADEVFAINFRARRCRLRVELARYWFWSKSYYCIGHTN